MRHLLACCLHQCRLFFIALQFFTRLPIPRWVGFEEDWLRHAARYFPLTGIVVATASAALYALALLLWPPVLAVLLATLGGIWLTGALHEDGFADMCDGFGGGATRERVLDIMRDSHIGAYGALGIVGLLALKCVALSLLPPGAVITALFVAHPLSRLAAAALIWRLDYARPAGKAKALAQQMSGVEFAIAAVGAALPAAILLMTGHLAWPALLGSLLAASLATAWLSRKFVSRIGGYTGDCLGAVQQVTEIVFYLGLLASFQQAR
jgi:adenosylcobinamide-GDP ribazoletransferase